VHCTIFSRYRIPLKTTVIGNFGEAIKRIREVKFWPDQVVINLVSLDLSVRDSVLLLKMRVIVENGIFPYISGEFDLTEEYLQHSVDYDTSLQAIVIPIRGVKSIIFLGKNSKKIFSKK